MSDYPKLVWLPGPRGPIPAVWMDASREKSDGKKRKVLASFKLKRGEEVLGLIALARLYPCGPMMEEAK